MKFRTKQKWNIIRDYSIGWTLSFIFLCIVRGVGTEEIGYLQFDFWPSILIAITIGPILGCVSGYAQILTEERIYQRISIQRLLIVRFFYSIAFIILLILVAYVVYQVYFGTQIGIIEFSLGSGSYAVYFYVISVDLFMVTLRQINLMLGEKKLGEFLTGKFYTPREEERIFMFLDLQSSTKLAEKLGHIQYSKMIQDCFNDLGVVIENEAEIYQYVGDEVVLTWKLDDGLRNQNCIKAYFNFKTQLVEREEYYMQQYGSLPFFKAGLHAGIVTVTEVGKYKKEIAYHGDTMNTTARIQGKCNDFKQELLISEYLKHKVDGSGFGFEALGSVALKGKEQQVNVSAVTAK